MMRLLRRACPWRLLLRLNDRFGWCWDVMAMWKMFGTEDPWRSSLQTCARDIRRTGSCWCGKYNALEVEPLPLTYEREKAS